MNDDTIMSFFSELKDGDLIWFTRSIGESFDYKSGKIQSIVKNENKFEVCLIPVEKSTSEFDEFSFVLDSESVKTWFDVGLLV